MSVIFEPRNKRPRAIRRRTFSAGLLALAGCLLTPGVVNALAISCGDARPEPCYEGSVKGGFNAYRVVLIPGEGADDNEVTLKDTLVDRLRGSRFEVTSPSLPGFNLRLVSGDDGICIKPQNPSETTIYVETNTKVANLRLEMLQNRNLSERPGLVPTWVADLHFKNENNGSVFHGVMPLCPDSLSPEIQQWPSGIRANQVTDGSLRDYPLVLQTIHRFRRIK